MGHLRSHNCLISQLDYSKVSVKTLSIEMIQGGVVSSFLKECPTNSTLPYKDCILRQSTREVVEASKQFNNSSSSNSKAQTLCSQNISSNQIAAVATSQLTNNKSPMSLLLNKTKRDALTCTSSTKDVSLVTAPTIPPVNSLQTHRKDPSATNTKTVPTKLVLVLDKLNKPLNLKQNAKINVLPPNELFSVSESMIVDDNSSEAPKLSIEEDVMNVESVSVTDGFSTTSNNTSNKTKHAALPAKPLPAKSALGKKLCADCGNSCLNMTKHLNGCGRPTNPHLKCERCELILPTKCALKCHLRIHDKLPPYKCPDCGKDFTNWDDLFSHLKMSCGHIAKCVRYYCHSCKKHFASKSILANHISDLHSRDIFRCSSCPVAFYNKSSLDKHMITTVHKEETVVLLNQKQCNMCPTKLMPLEEFESHIQNHTNNNSALIYGYKCPWCTMVYVNKMAFIIHQVDEKKEIENSNNTLLKNKFLKFLSQDTALSGSESNKKENSHSDFEFVEQFANLEFNLPAAEKDPLSSDDWEFLQGQKVKGQDTNEEVCIICKKHSVVLLPGVNINKQSLCCKQCAKTLDDQSMVQNGQTKINNVMSKKYVSSNMDYKETTKTLKSNSARVKKRSYSFEQTETKSRKLQKSAVPPNRADSYTESNLDTDLNMPVKKRIPKKYPDKKIDFGGESAGNQGQVIAFKSPNKLACAKCKFVANTKETFVEHITVHRMDPNTYQCLECGLCFVVLPSLGRHLRMYHGIQDVHEYTSKNKSSLPKKSDVKETQCLQENQCRVCMEIYDSNSSLEKHFRTHGMAFMSSLSKSP